MGRVGTERMGARRRSCSGQGPPGRSVGDSGSPGRHSPGTLPADREGGVLNLGIQRWALEPEEEKEEIDELVRLEDEIVG